MSFLLKKLLYLLPVLLAVSLLTYFLSALLPGDVVAAMLGDQATPDAVAELRHKLGLDAPLWRQYVDWLARILTGDFGVSRVSGEKVLGAILERLPVSLELMGLAELGAILIAVPIGIWAALRAGSAIDRWLSGSAFFLLPMPSFLLAILLIFVMAVRFHLLPSTGFQSLHEGVIGNLRSMALPAATLALLEWPALMRVLRADMITTLQENFIAMAEAKGLQRRRILWLHALKPSSLTLVTLVGLNLGRFIGGAVIVETIFALPGFGSLIVGSIRTRDFALLQGAVLFTATAYVMINFIVDLLYAALDPRVRHGRT